MITKRHQRYLAEYPNRIAAKRRQRVIKVRNARLQDAADRHLLRNVLGFYSKPKLKLDGDNNQDKGSAWTATGTNIKKLFTRKPTV